MEASVAGRIRRILIVEDSQPTASALAKVVDRAGFASKVCLNGSDALKAATSEMFDAALIDIHLPDLNGLALSSTLRNLLGEKAPIIVVSGDTSMENLNALQHVGATYFFSKPVSPKMLLHRLEESFKESTSGHGA
jgi:DNA-binding response OmpR family regulator